jgi:hypothetical protein
LLKLNSVIKNIKGRDKLNIINSKLELPYEHELTCCEVIWNPESFGIVRSEDLAEIACSYFLITPFDHFEGQDIFHKVSQSIAGDTPSELSLQSIISDDRLTLSSFRIGLDSFGQSSFANWFIPTPLVLESLIIEANESGVRLRIQSENHKVLSEPLYDEAGYFLKVLQQIALHSGTEILTELNSKLSKN